MMRALALALVMTCAQAQPAGLPMRDGLPTLAPILEKVTPAVVNIAVLQRSPEEQNPLMRDPFFRRFFGMPQQSQPQIAAGSGVIVDAKNGYVITNSHVVGDQVNVAVRLYGKDPSDTPRELEGRVVEKREDIDLVVVQIQSGEIFRPVQLGRASELQIGDGVVAIGAPEGLEQSVTQGIVSQFRQMGEKKATSTSSRPTRRSIPATRAARSST